MHIYHARKFKIRSASSLTAKRVKTDKAFLKTMALAGIFGKASGIASKVYNELPEEQRKPSYRYQMIRTAREMLNENYEESEVVEYLKGGTL